MSEVRQPTFEQEISEHVMRFFQKSMKTRNWSPWHDFPLEEMEPLGDRLSTETVALIEGSLSVEEHVAEYTRVGLELFDRDRTRRNLQLQWGAEEARHGAALELALQHSGVRTETQIRAYLNRAHDVAWNAHDHAGLEAPLGATVYSMVQEWATYLHYVGVRARIRREYGLPPTATPEESERGYEVGASECFRRIAHDELAHHGLFLKIVRSSLDHFPSRTSETLHRVLQSFEMPALRSIPNLRVYLRAALRAKLTPSKQDVRHQILACLGID